MSRRKKNSSDFRLFLRYSGKGMKGKERNAFERRLQKDSFDADAAEGLSMVTPDEAEEDMHAIIQRLNRKRKQKIPVFFLRIAAVVTLLLATTVTLMILRNDRKQPLVSENIKSESKEKELTVTAASPVYKVITPSTDQKPGQIEHQEKSISGVSYVAPVVMDTISENILNTELAVADGEIAGLEDQKLSNFRLVEVMEAKEKAKSPEKRQKRTIEGTVISTDDNLPVPGATIVIKGTNTGVVSDINGKFSLNTDTDSSLMLVASFIGMKPKEFTAKPDSNMLIAMNSDMQALDEVVVVGYGVARKEATTGAAVTINNDDGLNTNDYIPPEPISGYTGFKQYVELNMRYPDNIAEKTRKIVVLSMIIRYNGTPDNIRIVKSPGKEFSDEAIRLINEGPAWKPATLNGTPQEEEVKVRIVFKP